MLQSHSCGPEEGSWKVQGSFARVCSPPSSSFHHTHIVPGLLPSMIRPNPSAGGIKDLFWQGFLEKKGSLRRSTYHVQFYISV